MGWTEIVGFVTGVVCVFLQVRENIWNWPIGITNNLFYLVLFWQTKLYADSGLQVFYIAISVYGWITWFRGGGNAPNLAISRTGLRHWAGLAVAFLALTASLHWLLQTFTDSNVPFWDGLTTAMSLIAQYMLSRKLIENWLVWIAADVIYIGLYGYKSLYLTGFLYFVFLLLCVAGYLRWNATLKGKALVELVETP